MSRRSRRGTLAAVLALALAPLAAGCAAGFTASTNRPYTPADGAVGDVGSLKIRNVLVVSGGEQAGAVVVGSIVNDGTEPDQLTSLRVGEEEAALPDSAEVPPGAVLQLGPGGEDVTLPGGFEPGVFVDLTMSFRNAGEFTERVLVQEPAGAYATVTPPPVEGAAPPLETTQPEATQPGATEPAAPTEPAATEPATTS